MSCRKSVRSAWALEFSIARMLGFSLAGMLAAVSSPASAEKLATSRPSTASKSSASKASPAPTAEEKKQSRPPAYLPRFGLRREGRWIQSGLRLEKSGESLLVGRESFLTGGDPQGVELPDHLGGGFIFYQPVADGGVSATAIYRASSWTAPLVPLVRVPFPVEFIEPGFDRLYLLGVSVHVALDIESGEILPLDPLPPVVSIQSLSFSGSRRALIDAPIVGALYTRDAGVSWRPIREALSVETRLGGECLFVRTAAGSQLVEDDGRLSAPVHGRHFPISHRARGPLVESARLSSVAIVPSEAEPEDSSAALLGDARERALLHTLTQGVPVPGGAVSLNEGELYWLNLNDSLDLTTQTLDSSDSSTPELSKCFGVPGADAKKLPLFVCRGAKTSVLRLEAFPANWSKTKPAPLLKPLFQAKTVAAVLAYGDGGVLIESECSGSPAARLKSGARNACVITSAGLTPVSIPHPQSLALGTSVSFAVDATQAWQVWLDRKKSKVRAQALWRAPSKHATSRSALKPTPASEETTVAAPSSSARSWQIPLDASIGEFFESGSLLPLGTLQGDDLLLWATSRDRFVGLRLGEAKQPDFGAVQRPLKRAVFDGPRAMIWGAAGFAKESVDGGIHFTEASYPYRSGDAELSHVVAPTSAVHMGCGPVGCALGRLLKFGWEADEIKEAKLPASVPLSPRGGQRFRFTCHSGGVNTQARSQEGTAVFSSFWEQAAPQIPSGDEGFSVPFSQEFGRIYAWGPKEASWTRKGGAQLRFFDPWSPEKIRNTAVTPHLFASAIEAQEGMGLLDRISGSRAIVFDPAGDRGAFVLRTRNETELFTFIEGAPLEHVRGAEELDLRNLQSAVFARGRWYAAFQRNSTFAVVRLEGGEIELIAELPLGDAAPRGPDLVRTSTGDLGVSIVGDTGLLVYPLSADGALGSPILVDEKSQRPLACPREASGFLVNVDLSLTPYLETAAGHPIKVSSMKARMIVGHGPPCLEALVAATREDVPLIASTATKISIPLSLLNVDSDGDRKLLSCE